MTEKTSFHPNPIFKAPDGSASFSVNPPYRVRIGRRWMARCPDCGEIVKGSYNPYSNRHDGRTRKSAKDVLHWHRNRPYNKFWRDGCKAHPDTPPALVGS